MNQAPANSRFHHGLLHTDGTLNFPQNPAPRGSLVTFCLTGSVTTPIPR